MSTQHHLVGTAFIENQAVGVSPAFEPTVNSGRAVELGATNDLAIPVGYDLGVEQITTLANNMFYSDETSTFTKNSDTSFDLSVTVAGTSKERPLMENTVLTTDVGGVYLVSFNAIVNSGTPIIYKFWDGAVSYTIDYTIKNGYNEFTIDINTSGTLQYIYFDGTNTFDIEVTDYSTKQITTTGYLTYETDYGVVQLEGGVDLPNSTTYTLVDDTYRWAYVNENPFSEADLAAIEAEPNKIVEFAMDGTGLTNTKGVDDKFYGFRENSGAYCVDALSVGADLYNGSSVVNGDETTTFTSNVNGFDLAVTVAGTNTLRPRISLFPSSNFEASKFYMIEIAPTSLGGTCVLQGMTLGSGAIEQVGKTLDLGQAYGYVFNGGILTTSYNIYFDGTDTFGGVFTTTIREATASEISNYTDTIRTNVDQSPYGIQWTCAELDGAGVPTAYNSTPNTAIMHSDTVINTGFKPNLDVFSLVEKVSGLLEDLNASGVGLGTFTQREEERVLTHDVSGTDKYYINKTLLGYVPALPSATTAIDLNDTAVIGYADTIERRDGNFKVYSTVIVP